MSKKKLFENNLDDHIKIQDSFTKGIQKKNDFFSMKSGRVLFELQKTYKGDDRFQLDDRFMDDIDQKLLPESAQLNLDQDIVYNLEHLTKQKNDNVENQVDESWGIINNEDELWREKSKYYQILEKVLGQEIFKVRKKQKFNPIKRYDPTQQNLTMRRQKVESNPYKQQTKIKSIIQNKQIKKQPKRKKIKKKNKIQNNQQNDTVQKPIKKKVKINFKKLKEIKSLKDSPKDFKLFSQLIKTQINIINSNPIYNIIFFNQSKNIQDIYIKVLNYGLYMKLFIILSLMWINLVNSNIVHQYSNGKLVRKMSQHSNPQNKYSLGGIYRIYSSDGQYLSHENGKIFLTYDKSLDSGKWLITLDYVLYFFRDISYKQCLSIKNSQLIMINDCSIATTNNLWRINNVGKNQYTNKYQYQISDMSKNYLDSKASNLISTIDNKNTQSWYFENTFSQFI